MSDKVINLGAVRQERRLIWVCNCGCTVHRAYSCGEIECAECEAVANGYEGEWRSRLPAAPQDPKEIGPGNFKVISLDSAATFLKRQLPTAGAIVAVIVLDKDGGMATYAERALIDPAKNWLHDQLAIAERRMTEGLSR